MRSVADQAVSERRSAELALTATERLSLAFQLWDDDLELFRSARGLERDPAQALLRARRQLGRRLSRCMQDSTG